MGDDKTRSTKKPKITLRGKWFYCNGLDKNNENGDDLNMNADKNNGGKDTNAPIVGDEYYIFAPDTRNEIQPKDKFSEAISEKLRFSRFNEDRIVKTLVDYIATTYGQHYVDGDKQTQTIETIRNDRIPGFCIGNITKYLDRYDKKGTPRSDLLKASHYLILLLNHENIYD